jgi:hypothetical protein
MVLKSKNKICQPCHFFHFVALSEINVLHPTMRHFQFRKMKKEVLIVKMVTRGRKKKEFC